MDKAAKVTRSLLWANSMAFVLIAVFAALHLIYGPQSAIGNDPQIFDRILTSSDINVIREDAAALVRNINFARGAAMTWLCLTLGLLALISFVLAYNLMSLKKLRLPETHI